MNVCCIEGKFQLRFKKKNEILVKVSHSENLFQMLTNVDDWPKFYQVYRDASKSDKGVGFTCFDPTAKFSSKFDTSVFMPKLLAIHECTGLQKRNEKENFFSSPDTIPADSYVK